jgi:signal transduction histidine kinase
VTETSAPAVLLVDDDPRNLLALEALLEDLGLTLVKASSGAECLRALLDADFAAVLLDVHMPGMDGLETAALIRARPATRHIPIVFLTAHTRDDSIVDRAYDIGAVDFLYKPLHPAALRAKVSTFVELHRRRSEAARAERIAHEQRLAELRTQMANEALHAEMALERRANDRLCELAEQLRIKSEELEEAHVRKDEFLAMLGHELRNPLASLQYALEVARAPEHSDAVLGVFERQVKHLKRLVAELLDVTRVSRGTIALERAPTSLRRVVTTAIEQCQQLLTRKRHELVLELPDEDIEIVADEIRLTQVMANLMANAARYTDPGGRVRVAVRCEGEDAVIEVADNGRGIAPSSLPRIFDPFVQIDRSADAAQGFGLGLSLVRRLVELHGGCVTATSAGIGQGSRFTLRLPGARVTKTMADAPVPTPTMRAAPMDIVLIDDNEDLLALVAEHLRTRGHVVSEAEDGITGLQLLLDRSPRVALVDIGLPGMDGYEIARRFRALRPTTATKLVAMTGYGQAQDRHRALEAGFDEHLVKPVVADVLERVLLRQAASDSKRIEA